MRSRSPILLALVCLAALLVAGCGGGSSSGPSPEVTKLLGDTFGADKPVTSGRLDIRLSADATGVAGLPGPLDLRFTGPFQSRGAGRTAKFDFDLALRRGGSTLRAGAVSTGDQGYLKLIGNAYRLDDKAFAALQKSGNQAAASATKKDGGISLSKLGIDPRRWLRDAKEEGSEQVAGTPTVHVSSAIEVAPMLADVNRVLAKAGTLGATAGPSVPTGIDPVTRSKIEKSVKQADLDVWTGKADHALRRIRVHVRFDVPENLRSDRSRPEKGTIGLDLTIAGLNERQAIGAPAAARPIGDLTAALQQVLAQAQAHGGGTAGPGSSSSTQPKYDACVQAAGSDISKAQECASLLGQ
ncbi:MAG: hypothetical protein M3P44_03400 [Actinomycetota bacterium]|nr:hypothetical protein [Actinomycetota bacterium]